MNDEDIAPCIFFIGIVVVILLILNGIFWLNQVPCSNNTIGCVEDVVFDLHGFAWWHYLILSLVIIEISFIILTYLVKKEESLWEYVGIVKGMSIGCLIVFYLVVFPLGWLIYKLVPFIPTIILAIGSAIASAWKPLVFVIGIIGLVVLYYLVNIGVAKLILNGKKKKRTKKRVPKYKISKSHKKKTKRGRK